MDWWTCSSSTRPNIRPKTRAQAPAAQVDCVGKLSRAGLDELASHSSDARAGIAQTSLRSKRVRGIDARDGSQWRQGGHDRRDEHDRGAYHKRTGTEIRQDRG